MKIRESNQYGSTLPKAIDDFEGLIRGRIPQDYRIFLLEHNGGDPRPVSHFDYGSNGSSTSLKYFYGLHDGPDWASLGSANDIFAGRIPSECIPIAGDEYGNQLILYCRGSKAGSVYLWDHEQEHKLSLFRKMNLVAKTFLDLGNLLYEFVPEDESEVDRIIRKNDVSGLSKLITNGYDLESTDEYDRTFIENATIHNRDEMIKVLFLAGADIRESLSIAEGNLEYFPENHATIHLIRKLQTNKNR